jgi:hypothetical protein
MAQAVPGFAELEAAGATIGHIRVVTQDRACNGRRVHTCRKYMRSMRGTPIGGRPTLPLLG